MSEIRNPDEFPRGLGPEANYTSTDVTTTTSAEELVNTVRCQHIKAGQKIMIHGVCTIALGASSVRVDVDIVEGAVKTGTDVGEASETLCTASKDIVVQQMVTTRAYQDKPNYSMTIKVDSAAANCTAQSSCLIVIPVA